MALPEERDPPDPLFQKSEIYSSQAKNQISLRHTSTRTRISIISDQKLSSRPTIIGEYTVKYLFRPIEACTYKGVVDGGAQELISPTFRYSRGFLAWHTPEPAVKLAPSSGNGKLLYSQIVNTSLLLGRITSILLHGHKRHWKLDFRVFLPMLQPEMKSQDVIPWNKSPWEPVLGNYSFLCRFHSNYKSDECSTPPHIQRHRSLMRAFIDYWSYVTK